MPNFGKTVLLAAVAIAVAVPVPAFAVSGRTWAAGRKDVAQLLRMMDQDQNGSVSKEEFMQFMSAEFDRLDVDRSGELSREEISRSHLFSGAVRVNPHR